MACRSTGLKGRNKNAQDIGLGSVGQESPVEHDVYYRNAKVDGLNIFFREAGQADAPTVLLLHGLPSSSRMFEPLLTRLSDRYHLVAPDPNVDRYDPDSWTDEFAFLNQPGQAEIQTELFYDYRSNVASYATWQAWLRATQPRMLVIWGKYDPSFALPEPEAFRRDLPDAAVHILEAGHFALDVAADQIAALMRDFLGAGGARGLAVK